MNGLFSTISISDPFVLSSVEGLREVFQQNHTLYDLAQNLESSAGLLRLTLHKRDNIAQSMALYPSSSSGQRDDRHPANRGSPRMARKSDCVIAELL